MNQHMDCQKNEDYYKKMIINHQNLFSNNMQLSYHRHEKDGDGRSAKIIVNIKNVRTFTNDIE